MNTDYSEPLVHATAYLKQAEDCLRRNELSKGKAFLAIVKDRIEETMRRIDVQFRH